MDLVKTDTRKGRKIGYFNSYVLKRIKENKNFVCCITGQLGSGKSYSSLREGEVLDPDFTIDNVAFTPEQFMDLVNGVTKKLKRGSVIVYDEVQVTMSALEFQSLQARLINSCLQTFRYMGFILFMTSPFFTFINKSARKLFHSRWETISIDTEKKLCSLKPFLLQTNQETGQTYRKYLRIWTAETGIVPFKRLKLSLPSKELREAYEEKRQKFSQDLNKSIAEDLKRMKEKKRRPLTDKQVSIITLLKEGLTIPQVAERIGVVDRVVYEHIKLIKKKDIEIIPIKKDKRVMRYDIKGYDAD